MCLYWMEAVILNQLGGVWLLKYPIGETDSLGAEDADTPPSSRASFKTTIPAPFSFACIILSVLEKSLTQYQRG